MSEVSSLQEKHFAIDVIDRYWNLNLNVYVWYIPLFDYFWQSDEDKGL